MSEAVKWLAVVMLGVEAGVAGAAVPAGCYVDAKVIAAPENDQFLATGICNCFLESGILISESEVHILASFIRGQSSVPKVHERFYIAKRGDPADGIDGIFIVASAENGLRGTSVLVPADEPINVFLKAGESLDRSLLSIRTIGPLTQTFEVMR